MTQELANNLISYYQKSIRELNSRFLGFLRYTIVNWQKYLRNKYIDRGICYCAENIFSTDLQKDGWVRSKCRDFGVYWGTIPTCCSTREEAIKALQLRVDILKTFKENVL